MKCEQANANDSRKDGVHYRASERWLGFAPNYKLQRHNRAKLTQGDNFILPHTCYDNRMTEFAKRYYLC